jgi:hypothetical protein
LGVFAPNKICTLCVKYISLRAFYDE